MATYLDSIKFEEKAPGGTIRLIKSGEFYRAYDHSAWLFQTCIAQHKVIRRYLKTLGRDIFYVGFPEKSLISNVGERKYIGTALGCDIELEESEVPDEEGFKTWKATVETADSSKGDFHSLPLSGTEAEREVIRRLREVKLESKSMVECAVFLSELRKLLIP